MTTRRPPASEMHPTAELRNWVWLNPEQTAVHGQFYNHPMWVDGTIGKVVNIIAVAEYSDHYMIRTLGDEIFKMNKLNHRYNGG